jgi:gamma-glutamyl:cysteine ligase YbdK (ATP-grasp superfamily)
MNLSIGNFTNGLYKEFNKLEKIILPYRMLEVFGPEHEYSIVNEELKPLPIAEQMIKDYCGKNSDLVFQPRFNFGKEVAQHQIEIKAKKPFKQPEILEENMQLGVTTLLEFLNKKYHAHLLGTGMHPTLKLEETRARWPITRKPDTLQELKKIFDFKSHGWLNIQSFQLNLPYYNQKGAVILYNALTHLCAYLPAISASSPICEGNLGPNVDNRLHHYKIKMKEIPSITGDVVPDYITSLDQYRKEVVGSYQQDLANAGIAENIVHADWIDQRGLMFKLSRRAIELRIMDEQECIKSDVALSCFIRAAVRGLIVKNNRLPPHELLVNDYNAIVKNGLSAEVMHPEGKTARQVCQHFFNLASEYANESEHKYLWIVQKRIAEGSLSELIRDRVSNKAKKTTLKEAVVSVYTQLLEALADNQPYF